MKTSKKNLSPEFWVSTLVLLAMLAGFVVWTKSNEAFAEEGLGSFTIHKKMPAKKIRR